METPISESGGQDGIQRLLGDLRLVKNGDTIDDIISSALVALEGRVIAFEALQPSDPNFEAVYYFILRHLIAFIGVFDGQIQKNNEFDRLLRDNVIERFFRKIGQHVDLVGAFQAAIHEFEVVAEESFIDESAERVDFKTAGNALGDRFLFPLSKEIKIHCLALLGEAHKDRSFTDPLTRVCNRRRLDDGLKALFGNQVDVCGKSLAFIFIDLDHFKRVNDNHGHNVGDRVLATVGNVLIENTRLFDIVGRYGGEEFVFGVPDVTFDETVEICHRLGLSITDAVKHECPELPEGITASIGIAFLGHHKDVGDADELLGFADRAVYGAKKNGRNCIVCIDADGKLYEV